MFSVLVLGLVALAAAEPEIQQQIQLQPVAQQQHLKPTDQHQVVENPNAIPLYKQAADSTPLIGQNNRRFISQNEEMKGRGIGFQTYPNPLVNALREQRFSPYNEEMEERYPFLPYNYENINNYPYRSNYFLRYLNKPEMSESQPKVDYDSQDIYHLHHVNHQHIVNNVHNIQQKHIIRKLDQDVGSPNLHYSQMYKLNMFNKEYPNVNKYYGKSLEQENIQPWTNNYYNRYWDTDYIRNYDDNLNSKSPRSYMYRNWVEPFLHRNVNLDYEQPITSSENLNMKYTKGAKNLDIGDIEAGTVYPLNRGYPYGSNLYSNVMEKDYVQPWVNRNVQPVSYRSYKGPEDEGVNYIPPFASINSQNINWDKPFLYRNIKFDYTQPTTTKSQGVEDVFPVALENPNLDYDLEVPVSSMIAKGLSVEGINHRNYFNPTTYKTRGINYVNPMTSNSHDVDLDLQPVSTRTIEGFGAVERNQYHSIPSKSQIINYIHPTSSESQYTRFVMPTYQNLEHIPITRPKRSLEAQVGTHVGLNQGTPLTEPRHNTATNLELSHQVPAVSIQQQHAKTDVHEQISNEGRREDIQLNTNVNAEAAIRSEDHISQQPIHRQARDTTTQIVDVPHYSIYPYYYYPYHRAYLPLQPARLVTRSALYPYIPYYYNLLFRK